MTPHNESIRTQSKRMIRSQKPTRVDSRLISSLRLIYWESGARFRLSKHSTGHWQTLFFSCHNSLSILYSFSLSLAPYSLKIQSLQQYGRKIKQNRGTWLLTMSIQYLVCLRRPIIYAQTRGVVSKETVVLRRWGREHKTLDLSTEFIRYIGHRKEIESWRFER